MSYGHYYSVARVQNKWIRFDDEKVDVVNERLLRNFYGVSNGKSGSWPCAYMLVYESEDVMSRDF